MSSPNTLGDPRSGRDRRVPTRTRTFKHGHVDPVINHKRPLLTVGNIILLVVGIGYGMYATGNLPQLDAFFDRANAFGRSHNNTVVTTLITYGSFIFGAVILGLFGLIVFSFVNTHRRRASDPKGWDKVADAPVDRRKGDRRVAEDLPSLIMPIGKERPGRRSTDEKPAPAPTAEPVAPPVAAKAEPAAAKTEAVAAKAEPVIAKQEPVAEKPNSAKAEAMAAAAKAEAALAAAPPDLPSFVAPLGKTRPVIQEKPAVAEAKPAVAPVPAAKAEAAAPVAEPVKTASPAADGSLLTPTSSNAKAEAAIAAAKAAALKAEAAAAAAKAEAAIAAAKAEAAAAEAALAAAKAEVAS